MTIQLGVPDVTELRPRITVFGVGGAGGNAVNNMINANLEGVEFVVANTDAQALSQSACERRIQMGASITEGLGAGSRPEIGRAAAEESLGELIDHLAGCHMVFVTAGMGGGTGTGAAPVIAQVARDQGILTVGVVTKPFQFEGARRLRLAEAGIEEFQKYADTLLVIPNQNLFRIANENTTFAQAFAMADEVLHSGVRGITDLMVMPGLINLDFADVRSIMNEMGKAMMGTGEAEGEKRAIEAAEAAISNPLLDDVSMKGARGVLINITGGLDLGLYEVDEAANRIRAEVDADANIIVGSTFDERLEGTMRVSVVATGIDSEEMTAPVEDDSQAEDFAPPVRRVWSTGSAEPKSNVHAMTEAIREELDVVSEEEAPVEEVALQDTQVAQSSLSPEPTVEAPLVRTQAPQQPQPVQQQYAQAPQPAPAAQAPAQAAPRPAQQQPKAPLNLRAPVQQQPVQAQSKPAASATAESPEKKLSVFDRMMAGVKSARAANKMQPQARKTPILQPGAQPPAPRPEAGAETRRPPQAAQPAQTQEDGDLFSVTEEEEQLEIPAFLRRQAN